MKMDKLFEEYDCDTEHRVQAIFSSIFILQNRMQTAGEKLQTEIFLKQWLLLAMTACCPEPRTLTNIGNLMGCSRQNIKKLALTLEKKGFVRLLLEGNYRFQRGRNRFAYFLYVKLFAGIERVEKYAVKLG